MRGLFEGWHFVILALVVVALFGYKKMPDAARSIGRSMRIFKSEMDEMKSGGSDNSGAAPSPSAEDQAVHRPPQEAGDPSKLEKHNQPPA